MAIVKNILPVVSVIATNTPLVSSAEDRGRKRSAILIQNMYTGLDLDLQFDNAWLAGSKSQILLRPGETYIDQENAHGEVFQGSYFGTSVGTTVNIIEDLYS